MSETVSKNFLKKLETLPEFAKRFDDQTKSLLLAYLHEQSKTSSRKKSKAGLMLQKLLFNKKIVDKPELRILEDMYADCFDEFLNNRQKAMVEGAWYD